MPPPPPFEMLGFGVERIAVEAVEVVLADAEDDEDVARGWVFAIALAAGMVVVVVLAVRGARVGGVAQPLDRAAFFQARSNSAARSCCCCCCCWMWEEGRLVGWALVVKEEVVPVVPAFDDDKEERGRLLGCPAGGAVSGFLVGEDDVEVRLDRCGCGIGAGGRPGGEETVLCGGAAGTWLSAMARAYFCWRRRMPLITPKVMRRRTSRRAFSGTLPGLPS
jgi:hypothetical protein